MTPFWASFEGSFPVDVGPSSAAAPEPVKWAVDLLMLVVNTQKSQVKSMSFEVTWLLLGEISTAALVEHFGLSYSLGGLFASSGAFAICGDTTAELPDLFTVECDVFAGWLENSGEVGVQIKHWPQDDRFDPNSTVTFTPIVIDQFFALSPQLMQRQLAQYFPTPGDT